MSSEVLVPLQAGSWLMSILTGLGAVPVNLMVPLTEPTVLGSMVAVALGAAALCSSSLLACFLLQPASSIRPSRTDNPAVTIQSFLFMTSLHPFWRFERALYKLTILTRIATP